MRSHLLVGSVRHRRARPRAYEFTHRVYYLALDLDELPEVARRVPLIGVERTRPLAIWSRDHLSAPGLSLAGAVRAHLAAEGLPAEGWRITLVTNARVLGHLFNPVSFYLCRDGVGTLRVVLAEVANTHGDRHVYTLLPERPADQAFVAGADKAMYVSPFIGMAARYRFRIVDEAGALSIALHEFEPAADGSEALTLYAGLRLARRPLSTAELVRTLLRHPHITLATISLIHLHAARLWLRGVRFLPYRGVA